MKLGQWIMSDEVPTDDEILANVNGTPYNEHMHRVLSSSVSLLKSLMNEPDSIKEDHVPALYWLRNGGDKTFEGKRGIIPYVGNLTVTDRAMLHKWFHVNVAEENLQDTVKWIGKVPIAHAITIIFATTAAQNQDSAEDIDVEDLDITPFVWEAWNFQVDIASAPKQVADPELECLSILERQMFEQSKEAGVAGNWQWGLDKGDHQNRWVPYLRVPAEWNLENRDESESESELEVRLLAHIVMSCSMV